MNEIISNSRGDQYVIKSKVVGFEIGYAEHSTINPERHEPAVLAVITTEGHIIIGFEVAETDEELKPLVERFKDFFQDGQESECTTKYNYHVHVYKVSSMAQTEVKAYSLEEARGMALSERQLEYEDPDCKCIAIAFQMGRVNRGKGPPKPHASKRPSVGVKGF